MGTYLLGASICAYVTFQFLGGEWLHQHPDHPKDKTMPLSTQILMLIPILLSAALWPMMLAFWMSNANRQFRELRIAKKDVQL